MSLKNTVLIYDLHKAVLKPCPQCGYGKQEVPLVHGPLEIPTKIIRAMPPRVPGVQGGQPLEQFEVFVFFNKNFALITNMIIYLFLIVFVIYIFFKLISLKYEVLAKNSQNLFEGLYNFILTIIKQQIDKDGFAYFPLVFCLFLFILVSNLLGMCLYSFTVTSHIIIAFMLSFSMFIGIVLTGIFVQKVGFLSTFVPSGAPAVLKPFLICIEIISYFSRPFSLGIRLFANLMSGHTLLAILANFAFLIFENSLIIGIIPIILIVAIVGLEAMIAGLQAYVFTVLVCIYLNESIRGSH
jgi:ATP synthase subunit 6